MTAATLALGLASTVPATLGAWALAALALRVLRVRDRRLRALVWTWAVADAALAVAGRSTASLVLLRLVVAPEFVADTVARWAVPVLCAWGAVAAALVARRVVETVRAGTAARVLHAIHGADPATERLAGGRRVALPPGDGTPFVAGVLRAVIVVPRGFWDRLGDDERRAVLAHEAAHVRRLDVALRFAARLVADALWFDLPLRAVVRRLDDALEGAADACAVRGGASPASLARALVAAASSASSGSMVPRGALGLHGGTARLAERIVAMRRPAARGVVLAQAAALVLLAPWDPAGHAASVVVGGCREALVDLPHRGDASSAAPRGAVAVGLTWSSNPIQRGLVAAVRAM